MYGVLPATTMLEVYREKQIPFCLSSIQQRRQNQEFWRFSMIDRWGPARIGDFLEETTLRHPRLIRYQN